MLGTPVTLNYKVDSPRWREKCPPRHLATHRWVILLHLLTTMLTNSGVSFSFVFIVILLEKGSRFFFFYCICGRKKGCKLIERKSIYVSIAEAEIWDDLRGDKAPRDPTEVFNSIQKWRLTRFIESNLVNILFLYIVSSKNDSWIDRNDKNPSFFFKANSVSRCSYLRILH